MDTIAFPKWIARVRLPSRVRLILVSLVVFVAFSPSAHAHLVTSGVGPFFDGVAHFIVSPEDLFTVAALALCGGISGKSAARGLVLTLPLAWIAGMFLGSIYSSYTVDASWVTAVSLLLVGLLLGIHPKLPASFILVISGVLGLIHGMLNGAAMVMSNTSLVASIGIVSAISVIALLMSAAAVTFSQTWQQVAFRAFGSWVAALGILVLAWHFRPEAPATEIAECTERHIVMIGLSVD